MYKPPGQGPNGGTTIKNVFAIILPTLVVCLFSSAYALDGAGTSAYTYSYAPPFGTANAYTSSDILEMEEEIKAIRAPLPDEDVAWMRYIIAQLPAYDKEQLEGLLDQQVAAVSGVEDNILTASALTPSNAPVANPAGAQLYSEIDNLFLGPEASVEDLRKRDKIVGLIAAIQDPNLRYELLQRLEDKERLSETCVKLMESLG